MAQMQVREITFIFNPGEPDDPESHRSVGWKARIGPRGSPSKQYGNAWVAPGTGEFTQEERETWSAKMVADLNSVCHSLSAGVLYWTEKTPEGRLRIRSRRPFMSEKSA